MLNTRQEDLSREWSQLLQRLFSPLNIETATNAPSQVLVHPEGVSLTIPGFRDIKGRQLSYADRGNRLFNKEDQRLANAVHQLFYRIQHFREAFDKGVHEERQRLARDLHDDVGAKLLTLVYSAATEEQAELARDTLQELRAVIRDLEHEHYSLTTSLAELRIETAKRCTAYDIVLLWNQSDDHGDYPLEARQHSNLQRIVRETVTNALRHSDTRTLQVDVNVEEAQLTLQVSNDNTHPDNNEPHKPGRGIRNIRSRAEELAGSVEWCLGEASLLGGCTVQITTPLKRKEHHE
jgi:signal transduction histidine kinase